MRTKKTLVVAAALLLVSAPAAWSAGFMIYEHGAAAMAMAGAFASLAAIRHSREEFLFDFAFLFPDGPFGKLVARIIVSPAHAKRFLEALQANIKRYEESYGTIVPSDLPPPVDFIQ